MSVFPLSFGSLHGKSFDIQLLITPFESSNFCHECSNETYIQHVLFFFNPDLLNIAYISLLTFFTEGHLKNRCLLFWQRWHFPFDKFICFNLCSVEFILWRHFHWNSLTLLVTLIFFNFVQICVQSILPPYCSSHLI